MKYTWESDPPWDYTLVMWDGDERVGYISIQPNCSPQNLQYWAQEAFEDACWRLGIDPDIAQVVDVCLQEKYRGEGYGVELYARMARRAAEINHVIVPSYVFRDVDTSTSEEARRVWGSDGLKDQVEVVEGIIAWGTT